jgi:hypothetical protein
MFPFAPHSTTTWSPIFRPDFAYQYGNVLQTQGYTPLCVYRGSNTLQRVPAWLEFQGLMLKGSRFG